MKIYGKRADDSLLIDIGAGMGVIMRGALATKPLSLVMLADRMGPWTEADNSLAERRKAQAALDRCRVIPLQNFDLGKQ